jgi:uncharacterized protein
MTTQSTEIKRLIMVRINPGEDILAALNEAVDKEKIANGVILNGLGSSRAHHYHVVASNELPPKELDPSDEAPRDIIAFSGLIVEGRIHAHIVLSDDQKAEGGHLEPGTLALTFAIVAIGEVENVDFTDWDAIKGL